MNSTTPMSVTETASNLPPLIVLLSFIRIPPIVTQFYLWGYMVTFVLGFIGNTLSFLTFSRPTLRHVSTGCLFLLLSMTDTLYLLVAVIDFFEFGVQVVPFYVRLTGVARFVKSRFACICVSTMTGSVGFVHSRSAWRNYSLLGYWS